MTKEQKKENLALSSDRVLNESDVEKATQTILEQMELFGEAWAG